MQKARDRQHYLCLYLLFSAVFFVLGNLICYSLPGNASFISQLKATVSECITQACPISFSKTVYSFMGEMKLPLFILAGAFTSKRLPLHCLAVSYSGFAKGLCSACFMSLLKEGVLTARYEVLTAFCFTLLQVCTVGLFCFIGAHTIMFSKKTLFPLRFGILLKQKSTYRFLIDILALCGILLVIIILKHGNLTLMISSKGM